MIDADDALAVDNPAIRLRGGRDSRVDNGLSGLQRPREAAVDVLPFFETGGMQDEIRAGGRATSDPHDRPVGGSDSPVSALKSSVASVTSDSRVENRLRSVYSRPDVVL